MSIFTDFARVHWNASLAAGMLNACTFRDRGVTKTVYVKYEEHDRFDISGHWQSKDYNIEYLHEDMPNLVEGFGPLSITERDGSIAKYRVRESPYVDEQRGMDGTYRCAVLTRDRARDS